MKRLLFYSMTMLLFAWSARADNLAVEDVTVPKGGTASLEIELINPTRQSVAFQFLLQLPEGLTVHKEGLLYSFSEGERLKNKGFSTSISYKQEDEGFQVLSYNTNLVPMDGTSGTIISIVLQADDNVTIGNTLQASLTSCFTTDPNSVQTNLDNVTFNITIGDDNVLLDENSTTAPTASNGDVNILVKRTINANNWSTICLPFDMTEEQTKAAFGNDVELAEFVDYEAEYDGDNVTGLTVNFTGTDLADGFYGNYPYLIKTSKDITEFAVTATINPMETDAVAEYDNGKTGKQRKVYGSLIGTYHAGDDIPANGLFLSGNKFWYSTGKTKIMAYRAYFTFVDVLAEVENASVKMFVDLDGEETGIENLDANVNDKSMIYDLSGRRVSKPQKGIYIVNGKKVMK